MTTTEATWRRDFLAVAHALATWVTTLPDGAQVIDADAPHELRQLYASLASLGYARGWMD